MNLRDYDAGLLNDYGGGNVGWWQDYIRAEIGRCNDYWREQVEQILALLSVEIREECPECGGSGEDTRSGVMLRVAQRNELLS